MANTRMVKRQFWLVDDEGNASLDSEEVIGMNKAAATRLANREGCTVEVRQYKDDGSTEFCYRVGPAKDPQERCVRATGKGYS